MAVGQGFEPWELLHSTVFKTAAFDHSATPPEEPALYMYSRERQLAKPLFFQQNQALPCAWPFFLRLPLSSR